MKPFATSPKPIIGKVKFAVAVLLIASAKGCAKAPVAASAAEPERRVVVNRPSPSPVARATARPTLGFQVDHGTARPAAPAPVGSPAAAAPTPYSTPEVKATPTVPAVLDVAGEPKRNFRAIPLFEAETRITEVDFSPANVLPTWQLKASGPVEIAKLDVSLADETNEIVEECAWTPAELGLPATPSGVVELKLPLQHEAVLTFLQHNPTLKAFTLSATFRDPAGQLIAGKKGDPVGVALRIQVL